MDSVCRIDEVNQTSCRDWSSLPIDIITRIGELLPVPNRIFFRVVCRSWCSSVSPVHVPPLWLLHPGDGPEYGEYTDSFTFYSVPTKTTFNYPLPQCLSGMHCVGSQDGWLVICDLTLNLCLFNPLTSVRIDLPPFNNRPDFKLVYEIAHDGSTTVAGFYSPTSDGQPSLEVRKFVRSDMHIRKIVFSSNPRPTSFTAMAISKNTNLAYTWAGETGWHIFEDDTNVGYNEDILFYDGKFCVLMVDAGVLIFEFTRTNVPKKRVLFEGYANYSNFDMVAGMTCHCIVNSHKYIFIDNDNRLFVVLRNAEWQLLHPNEQMKRRLTTDISVMVFRDEECGPYWGRVTSLKGQSFCIGNNNFFSLPLKDLSVSRGKGCMFLTDILSSKGCHSSPFDMEVFDMGVFNMEKQRFELMYPMDSELNWPNPPAVWFQPSFGH